MGAIANRWDTTALAGSMTSAAFTLQNADGTPYDISGLSWEYVVHADAADTTPLITVTTSAGTDGQLTVTTSPTSQVTLTLNPAATTGLPRGIYRYRHALWSNPGQTSALCWVQGQFTVEPVAQP